MFTPSATRHGITMVAATAIAVAMLPYGAAAADPSQDDQFLAVLQDKQIPAMENIATVVAAGHKVCQKLDDGVPARTVLDGLSNDAYGMNPDLREQADRLSATMSRFIAAAVEVYCPGDQSKIASLAASRTGQSKDPAPLLVVANYRTTPPADAHGAALGSPVGDLSTGDASQPTPPKIPPLKAPEAKIPRSPGPVKKPPPPPRRQPPPPPQQSPPPPPAAPPPPPPQQIPPPPPQQPPPQGPPVPAGPQPGSATDGSGGGNGGSGGGGTDGTDGTDNGGPAAPSPAPARAPGMIQLVPW